MLKVLVVDDYPLFRRGVKDLVNEGFQGAKIGEAGNAFEMLELLRRRPWDVAVLDINMPGMNGLDALKQVKQEFPKLPVLILSMYPEEQYAIRMVKAGADGYLTKSSAPEELVKAITKVRSGGKYVSPSLAEALIVTIRPGAAKEPHQWLSDREYQVLCFIGSGKTVGEIAGRMNLSVSTISTYRARILEKMGMKTNAELTRYVLQHGLAEGAC
ncbi:MAG TPA: response regulator transcription factor [Nitrospira sp.]|jgi:DNA-binding NarL/FixJ family response regulator|nr:response regulator transcription factor [Nitrospira sp.]